MQVSKIPLIFVEKRIVTLQTKENLNVNLLQVTLLEFTVPNNLTAPTNNKDTKKTRLIWSNI